MSVPSGITYDDVVTTVREMAPDSLVVPNLGTNTAALMHRGERDSEFYMWGGMGMVHSIGLGLAIARPQRPIIVLDGDGSLLMGLAGMSTIGSVSPSNLLHVVLDNQAWGNTGGQPTHTARGVDLTVVARGCGYEIVTQMTDIDDLRAGVEQFIRQPRLSLFHIQMDFVEIDRPPGDPDPIGIKTRFMNASLS